MSHPKKRQKIKHDPAVDPANVRQQRAAFLASMERGISPPRSSRATPERLPDHHAVSSAPVNGNNDKISHAVKASKMPLPDVSDRLRFVNSPFRLTKIRDLPVDSNIDTISLHDILGNPLIKEAWVFNFCFDIDWMMQHFDVDVRELVQVHVIHGSWRKEDSNKIAIDDACKRWYNVQASAAYLPDQFGTHHSKMFVLFTHDDQVEVIIHTANMLSKDWTNMTQAVWTSGPLPRAETPHGVFGDIGSGERFKYDLLEYLKSYKRTTQPLVQQLQHYDFSTVRGALVASVPAKIDNTAKPSSTSAHLWGYPQLREVTQHINTVQMAVQTKSSDSKRHLVAQVSSIATLPNGWLANLVNAFNARTRTDAGAGAIPDFSLIYPTAPNVAQSLDGYAAGGSIHTKAQSATHLKQIDTLRPYLCQWTKGPSKYSAKRELAAPHIKTYIQFSQEPTRAALDRNEVNIEWMLVTSANLSTQAWGSMPRMEGKGKQTKAQGQGIVHIQSFEIGVMVWPELFTETRATSRAAQDGGVEVETVSRMVPVFGRDKPDSDRGRRIKDAKEVVVGLRMPYDLPLTRYANNELPWSPGNTYGAPDSHGRAWG